MTATVSAVGCMPLLGVARRLIPALADERFLHDGIDPHPLPPLEFMLHHQTQRPVRALPPVAFADGLHFHINHLQQLGLIDLVAIEYLVSPTPVRTMVPRLMSGDGVAGMAAALAVCVTAIFLVA